MATSIALAAKRPLNWNLFFVDSQYKDVLESQLRMGPYAKARGAKVYGLCAAAPIKTYLNFRSAFIFGMMEGWKEFIHLPRDEKVAAMRDPAVRARLREHAEAGLNPAVRDPGKNRIEDRLQGPSTTPEDLGRRLAQRLLERGAAGLLAK